MPKTPFSANVTPLPAARLDRGAIFRQAHAAARERMTPSKLPRYGDIIDHALGMHVAPYGYRQAFANALRQAYRDARAIAASEAYEARRPKPSLAASAYAADLRTAAWASPITQTGNIAFRDLSLAADAIVAADIARQSAQIIQFPGARA